MKKDFELKQEDFDRLLGWLSPDRDEAGEKYEELRNGLIRFFRIRACRVPESLADETLNRVALKLSEMTPDRNVKKISFVLGFAANVCLEQSARRSIQEVSLDTEMHGAENLGRPQTDEENDYKCLDACLARLPDRDRELIIKYYQKHKSSKFEWRKKLAESFDISIANLHTKIHRMKQPLKNCIKKCLKEK